MNCFVVTVYMNEEEIVFPRTWAETKTEACMDMLVTVKDFYKLDMHEFSQLKATAKVNRLERPEGITPGICV